MHRIIFGPKDDSGILRGEKNPVFVYLDTSAWIDIVEAHVKDKHSILAALKEKIGQPFHIAVSIFNVVELIRPKVSETTRFFSPESMAAFTMVPMVGLRSSWFIVEDEITCYLSGKLPDTAILDNDTLKMLQDGYRGAQQGNLKWFTDLRGQFDLLNKKDRNQDLSADVGAHERDWSKISYRDFFLGLRRLRSASPDEAEQQGAELRAKKATLPNPKSDPRQIPGENEEVLKYARYRIQNSLALRHGHNQMSTLLSNPSIGFPGRNALVADMRRMQVLTLKQLQTFMPSCYWMTKVTYWNYYHAPQSNTGKLGDRNHAVYFPQVNYFATSDGAMAAAFGSERSYVFSRGKIRVFDCRRSDVLTFN